MGHLDSRRRAGRFETCPYTGGNSTTHFTSVVGPSSVEKIPSAPRSAAPPLLPRGDRGVNGEGAADVVRAAHGDLQPAEKAS
jgi:hypothetical protein